MFVPILLIAQFLISTALITAETPDVVVTTSGPVEGVILKQIDGKEVKAYYGIPFAKPPVGELRFKPPQEIQPWASVLKVDKPLPACYQQVPPSMLKLKEIREFIPPRPWSEDCLTLNIWTPNPKPENAHVFVFIHGGGFSMGSSLALIDGTILALDGFVLMTMNYRLSAFGFLSLGNSDAPGNVGLLDQNLALRWMKQNAEAFGGNSDSITLAGLSAGGASVGFHVLSLLSRGLYKRAIMMSGAPTNIWSITDPELIIQKAITLLESVGCDTKNITQGMDCLRHKHPQDIMEVEMGGEELLTAFIPTVDGHFISEHPSVSVKSGRFNSGDVMVGTAADEGPMILFWKSPNYFKTKDGRLFRHEFRNVLKTHGKGLNDLQLQALDVIYTNWSSPDDPIMLRDAAKDMVGNMFLDCHINEFTDSLVKAGNQVHRYIYDYKMSIFSTMQPDWIRASHGADYMPILGPYQLLQQIATATDITVFQKFLKHVTNFARTGDPNLSKDEYPDEPFWPQYKSGKQYNLFAEKSTIKSGYRSRECAAHLYLIPLLADIKSC